MKVQILNPFIQAAYDVLKAEANCVTQRGDLSLDKAAYITNDVTVILNLVGQVEGMVFYGLAQETAIFLASAILGEKFDELNPLAQSGIAELGNVITGRASVMLSADNIHCNISPPALLLGKGAVISTLDVPRIVVPLISPQGQIIIHLALRHNEKPSYKTNQIPIPTAPSF